MDDKDKGGDGAGTDGGAPECLLPYDLWTENALRRVVASALRHVSHEGLPGGHLFQIVFRTDHPGVDIPPRLRAQYPEQISLELHEDFWDLAVDEAGDRFSVVAAFGGVPATLSVPFEAVTHFGDPHVGLVLRFQVPRPADAAPPAAPVEPAPQPAEPAGTAEAPTEAPTEAQVVSLDAFRRRTPPKES